MKKIIKSSPPNYLTEFYEKCPDAKWDGEDGSFKSYNNGENYSILKEGIFQDQGWICAYCECEVPSDKKNFQRIEHFHSKKDSADSNRNWALDWSNVFGVCLGGTGLDNQHRISGKPIYSLPSNLSCDAFKDRQIECGGGYGLPLSCEGMIINPLQLPSFPCLFKLKKRTGELEPDADNCEKIVIADNCYNSVSELVCKTIDHLNLNCDRLNKKRLEVFYEYERIVKKASREGNRYIYQQLAERWFRTKWPGFFTTRRILLGAHAESYLKGINYDG